MISFALYSIVFRCCLYFIYKLYYRFTERFTIYCLQGLRKGLQYAYE